ncbi:hypothetical protein BB560_002771, partial [Smittium megazygosporum]
MASIKSSPSTFKSLALLQNRTLASHISRFDLNNNRNSFFLATRMSSSTTDYVSKYKDKLLKKAQDKLEASKNKKVENKNIETKDYFSDEDAPATSDIPHSNSEFSSRNNLPKNVK